MSSEDSGSMAHNSSQQAASSGLKIEGILRILSFTASRATLMSKRALARSSVARANSATPGRPWGPSLKAKTNGRE
eukprot:4846046-Pleurochrysis_carterae.AAC.1